MRDELSERTGAMLNLNRSRRERGTDSMSLATDTRSSFPHRK
jgi:hypothetical protein